MRNQPKPVEVHLVSGTAYPIETLYSIWEASRNNNEYVSPIEVNLRCQTDARFKEEVDGLFLKILNAGIPVAENVDFVFLLENVSVELREQMVRHRIGAKVGDRIGFDFAPDLADSTWWSQSMRILDMGRFVDEGRFRIPEAVQGSSDRRAAFIRFLYQAQELYRDLVKGGVPMEDARAVIPLCATHRISWKLNLAALKHIIGKRGCWILQLGIWEPVIRGMVEQLASHVSPVLRRLIDPPCIRNDKFDHCHFELDNERRVSGEDALPPCPLYLGHNPELVGLAASLPPEIHERFKEMSRAYGALWGRDVNTGERK